MSVRWQKMALLVFWVGSCVGKNQMCHLWVGCLFTLTDNVSIYAIAYISTILIYAILFKINTIYDIYRLRVIVSKIFKCFVHRYFIYLIKLVLFFRYPNYPKDFLAVQNLLLLHGCKFRWFYYLNALTNFVYTSNLFHSQASELQNYV